MLHYTELRIVDSYECSLIVRLITLLNVFIVILTYYSYKKSHLIHFESLVDKIKQRRKELQVT